MATTTKFKVGDKVKVAGRHHAITFKVLRVYLHKLAWSPVYGCGWLDTDELLPEPRYRVVRLDSFGRENEYDKTVVSERELSKVS